MGAAKFNIGDKVKIVNYGALLSSNDENGFKEIDIKPEVVGQIGIITQVVITHGKSIYSIEGIKEKHAWYDDGQLEMVNKNQNIE